MGILDDAIREHLELKRRLGASDEELKQKETEAFGPGSAPASAPEPAATAEEPSEIQAERRPAAEQDPLAEPDPWVPGGDEDDVLDRDRLLAEDSLERNGSSGPPPPVEQRAAERDDQDAEERHEDPLDEWEEEPAAPTEDVLRETPEFLEETPEHDRLWFEQKPPKDFDF